MMLLSEAIWYARTERGLSQVQLAAMLKVSRSQVANIEVGHFGPSIQTLEEIARALTCHFTTNGDCWMVDFGKPV